MDKIKEAEEYAQQFKTSASSEGLENIANDYLAGYKAGAEKYEALLIESVKALQDLLSAQISSNPYVMIRADEAARAIIQKSKSILND